MSRYLSKTEAQKAWRRDRSRVVQELRFIQWEIEDALLTELAERYEQIEIEGGQPVDLLIDQDAIRALFMEHTTQVLGDGSGS